MPITQTTLQPSPYSGRVSLPQDTPERSDVAAELDSAWSDLSAATTRVVHATSRALFELVREHIPDVQEVWVRMDTSHEPAHGHLDGIFARDNHDVLPEVFDADWLAEAEEYAWDLGHVAPMYFVRHQDHSDTRRLLIGVDVPHQQ